MECKHCGYKDTYTEQKGVHLGEYCSSCGKWLKWVRQEVNQGKSKEDYKNEYLKKEAATDTQKYYIKNLLRQKQITKYHASKIIELLEDCR